MSVSSQKSPISSSVGRTARLARRGDVLLFPERGSRAEFELSMSANPDSSNFTNGSFDDSNDGSLWLGETTLRVTRNPVSGIPATTFRVTPNTVSGWLISIPATTFRVIWYLFEEWP